jgi:hypothetical protein
MRCNQFTNHDVEINVKDGRYEVTIIYDLLADKARWRASRDYLVSWMKAHPIRRVTWSARASENTQLADGGRFVFIFLPEEFPEPPSELGKQVAHELCRTAPGPSIGWMVCPVSTASKDLSDQDMGHAVKNWAQRQTRPETLHVQIKEVKFRFAADPCTCMIVERRS